ncbi:hypothetical protein M8J77_000767 [Diaphorina citri]|nr:hypothetical protein M8J77_000767 [Diaphorina citri]
MLCPKRRPLCLKTTASAYHLLTEGCAYRLLTEASAFNRLAETSAYHLLTEASAYHLLAEASAYCLLTEASAYRLLTEASAFNRLAETSAYHLLAEVSAYRLLTAAYHLLAEVSTAYLVLLLRVTERFEMHLQYYPQPMDVDEQYPQDMEVDPQFPLPMEVDEHPTGDEMMEVDPPHVPRIIWGIQVVPICNAKPNQTLFIIGANRGNGLAAIQVGKAYGLTVFASVGCPVGVAKAYELGADYVVDHT